MRPNELSIYLIASEDQVYGDEFPLSEADPPLEITEEIWVRFDSDRHGDVIYKERQRAKATPSLSGQYWAVRTEHTEQTRSGELQYAGVCLVQDDKVVWTAPIGPVGSATPADNGSMAVWTDDAQGFRVLSSEGEVAISEQFESNIGAVAISPDGTKAAVSTAAPDKAVHLYDVRDKNYLGRVECGTETIQHIDFHRGGDGWMLHTYNIAPESDLDVSQTRKEALQKIPVRRHANEMELSGSAISIDGNIWHHVPKEKIMDALEVEGALRVPGLELTASCGKQLEPIESQIIYHDVTQARNSKLEHCTECSESLQSFPDSKIERTRP